MAAIAAQRSLPVAGGSAQWQIAVPNASGLVGLAIRLQVAVLDAPANALGFTVSNAVVAAVR